MTDEHVIKVLAEREGWTASYLQPSGRLLLSKGEEERIHFGFHYLTSRDALAPVLEKMAKVELLWLDEYFARKRPFCRLQFIKLILTIPPRDLAYAIAEAIEEKV